MKARLLSRSCALLLAALVAICPAIPQSSTAKPSTHATATLRVGLWTLWHDKEVTVSPTAEGGAAMRTCDNCAAARSPGQRGFVPSETAWRLRTNAGQRRSGLPARSR
jgi:hypothetical protein